LSVADHSPPPIFLEKKLVAAPSVLIYERSEKISRGGTTSYRTIKQERGV